MIEGTVMKSLSGHFVVRAPEGIFKCSALGIFRLTGVTPLAGDRVEIRITGREKNEAQIIRIHERKNELKRPKAANIDQVCIVFSSAMPRPDFLLIDKLIVIAMHNKMAVLLCENKADLKADDDDAVKIKEYDATGIKKTKVSATENINVGGLEMFLGGMITVFAGQSGVGKSSIINRIIGERAAEIGTISVKNRKGRHTTRHAELIGLVHGGYIIDTPGFSNLSIEDVDYRSLDCFYPEFERHIGKCRFNGCSHTREPGCAIRMAVGQDGIPEGRFERYMYIYSMLKEKDEIKYK